MARIRTIKPEFFKHEDLAEMPAMVRLLFIGLWTQADRAGRLEDRPKRLKAEIFPYDNYDVEKGLSMLSDSGFIVRYKVNANRSVEDISPRADHTEAAYIQIVNFNKHQQPNIKEKESTIPAPCLHGASITGMDIGNGERERIQRHAAGAGEKKSDVQKKPAEEDPSRIAQLEKFKAFQKWIEENAPRVAQMKEPFTFDQWRKATDQYGKIGTIIKSMHNYEPLLRKNRSAYLTLCNWKNRELKTA